MTNADLSDELLAWYDANARIMPWRVGPKDRCAGVVPDPYRIWLSEIMLQQTTVAAVKAYFLKFTQLWPTVHDLANAEDDAVMAAWAGLGYYARARNLLKCARVVSSQLGGVFPQCETELQALPGIGPYTSAAIAAIAFDKPATVLDGNVERVMSRMHLIEIPLPTAKPELHSAAQAQTPAHRPGDYAQAVMDLGATICTPKSPACGICPWRAPCLARKAGVQSDLPKKLPKTPKPVRHGVVFVAVTKDGSVLLERRPEKGLLGGMLGWPGPDWTEQKPLDAAPPVQADWTMLPTQVRHTFTHFHLLLDVAIAHNVNNKPTQGAFVQKADFSPGALPTVMRKVWDLAISANP